MPVPAVSGRIEFTPLTVEDLPLLFEWLRRPHLLEWWRGEQSLEELQAKYLPRVADASAARPFLVRLEHQPVGYIQYYSAFHGDHEWWPDKPGRGVYGIDQFLADEERLGRGLGTRMVQAFCLFVQQRHAVTEVRVDPRPDNARAIRCYEKAGFVKRGRIVTPDGDALWMSLFTHRRG